MASVSFGGMIFCHVTVSLPSFDLTGNTEPNGSRPSMKSKPDCTTPDASDGLMMFFSRVPLIEGSFQVYESPPQWAGL